MATTNTIGTSTLSGVNRIKFLQNTMQEILKVALVAEAVCTVDRSDSKYIVNPYGSEPTALVQAVAGTYSPSAFTTTDDNPTVTDEFIYGEQIKGYEEVFSRFDLYAARVEQMSYAVARALDKWVLNNLLETGTGTYTTPAGGFTTAGNLVTILGALISRVAGYAEVYKGLYLVVENTDLAGMIPAMANNGFSMSDAALKNGFMNSYMGVDIYVVRAATFDDQAANSVSGSTTWTNLNHRLFGVKGVSTYASPRGINVEEKGITAVTGKEVAVWGLCGFRAWNNRLALTIDITLA